MTYITKPENVYDKCVCVCVYISQFKLVNKLPAKQ